MYLGLISGTSMDAIDAALLDFDGRPFELIAARCHPIPDDTRDQLRAVCLGEATPLDRFWRLDAALGHLFADASLELLRQARIEPGAVSAVGSHGQTVLHNPDAALPYTVQIGDPNVIAERTGITTVADFRRRDIAAGGQGAPLAPAFHQALWRVTGCSRCIVNIGGIANLTLLPAEPGTPISGFDSGPGNTLLDAWSLRHLEKPVDEDGRWAAGGRLHRGLLEKLLADEYFHAAPPKSTGVDRFNLTWLDRNLEPDFADEPAQNVQRTLCELTAATIADAISRHAVTARDILICGGGAHNPLLMKAIAERLPECDVSTSTARGFDADWVEAGAFAWFAKRTLEGLPSNVPSVTGAGHERILGAIYRA